MSAEEPPTKKQKSSEDWASHQMNIADAVMKDDEGKLLSEIAASKVTSLQGLGSKADEVMDALNLSTVEDLATYKFFLMARAIKTLSETEGARPAGSIMNIDQALDAADEKKSLKEVLESPISVLQGLAEKAEALLKDLHVKTVGDLADFKYCKWAEAIVELAKYEETKTAEERKLEKELKKLG